MPVCDVSFFFQPYSFFDFRKGTLLLNNIFAVIAALLLTLGERAKSFEMLIIGRLIIGVNSGRCLFYTHQAVHKRQCGGNYYMVEREKKM